MRRDTILAVGLLVIMVAVASLLGGRDRQRGDRLHRPSTFFTGPDGARALLLVLRKTMGADAASQLRTPYDRLRDPANGPSTLVVAAPIHPLGEPEQAALRRWLARGGQLILASSDGWPLKSGKSLLQAYGVTLKAHLTSPRTLELEPGGLRVRLRPGARWSGHYRVLARSGSQVVAIEIPVERGRIVAIADPAVITNRALGKADNAVWLVHLIADWGNGQVLFDEYHLGFGAPAPLLAVIGRFAASRWGWPFVQLALVGLTYLTISRRRLGRAVRPPPRYLSDPGLLVQARAGLLEGAAAGLLALDQVCLALSHQLRDAAGRPADLRELQARLQRDGPEDSAEALGRLLDHWDQARQTGRLKPSTLLEATRLAHRVREEVGGGS